MDGANFMHIHNDTILNNAANTECCIKKQKLNFRMKYMNFLPINMESGLFMIQNLKIINNFQTFPVGLKKKKNLQNMLPYSLM